MIALLTVFALLPCLNDGGLPGNDVLASRLYCGYQHSDDYNRDHDDIAIQEFPWIAQLLSGKEKIVQCTGSLINCRYVLTNADCVAQGNLAGVRLGDYNVTSSKDCIEDTVYGTECSEPPQEFEVEKLIVHGDYNRDNSSNNIALIRLSRNAQFSDYIRPICLPSSKSEKLDGKELALSGWGTLGLDTNKTEVKKKIQAKLVSLEKCNEFYNKHERVITDEYVCAVVLDSYSCHGDGGGPLMLSNVKQQWEAVGLLLYGARCNATIPSVYLNVAKYIDWIEEHLEV